MAVAKRKKAEAKLPKVELASFDVYVKPVPVSMSVIATKIGNVQTADETRTEALMSVLKAVICAKDGEPFENIDEILDSLSDKEAGDIMEAASGQYDEEARGNL